jgi:predicted RND superfamily exporter protein
MLILILFLVVGGVMVYLAQNNLMQVTLHVGAYAFTGIPLFYVIVGSLLIGLGLAYVIQLVNSVFTTLSMFGKDHAIKRSKGEIAELTKRIRQLELENERLKHSSDINNS